MEDGKQNKPEEIIIDPNRLSRNFRMTPWKRGEKPVESDFRYLYLELNLSAEEIGEYLGISKHRVATFKQQFGLKKTMAQRQEAKERMNFKKYGTRHTIAMKETREKIKQSNLERHGAECVLSLKETHEKGRATMMERYGVEHALQAEQFMEKQRETNRAHWGTDYTTQSKEVQEKMKQSTKERFGVDNVFKLQEFQDLARDRMEEKYGERSAMRVPEFAEKQRKTLKENWGVEHPLENKEIVQNMLQRRKERTGYSSWLQEPGAREHYESVMLERYGTANTSQLHVRNKENFNKEYWLEHFIDPRLKCFNVSECASYHGVMPGMINKHLRAFGITVRRKYESVAESVLRAWLSTYDISSISKCKTLITGGEVDLYVKDYGMAIEYDGLLYHSQGAPLAVPCDKSENYHLSKTRKCVEKGVQLFHIFENEWVDIHKQDIWKSVILSKCGKTTRIFARKTSIEDITNKEAVAFCEQNHLQGGCNATINLGLKYDGQLVAVMTFSKPRFNSNYTWELVRYCTLLNHTVVGGASKLLTHFRKNHEGSILSYANRRWSNGLMYEKLGFTFVTETRPNYFYFKLKNNRNVKTLELYSRQKFQKHKLPDLLEDFDPDKSESENMFANGYRRIYDCGNLVYALD